MANNIFRLTAVSQNDPQSQPEGAHLHCNLTAYSGGTLESVSSPVNEWIHMPIPPPQGTRHPPTPPTWFMVMDKTIQEASFTIEIRARDETPTVIYVNGANMPIWVAENDQEDTNQIYKEGRCGIFGNAREAQATGQPINWIYTVTGGVDYPQVHPGNNG